MMSIEEAEDVIDNMYQDKHKLLDKHTENGIEIDLSKLDKITFTELETASVIMLREKQFLEKELREQKERYEKQIERLDDIIEKLENSKEGINHDN